MLRIATLLSASAFVALTVFDAYALHVRLSQPQAVSIAWFKLAFALAIQLAVVVGTFVFAVVVGARWSETELAGLSPTRSVTPFILLLVAGGFSASLLYNSLVCGNQSLPSVRGVPLCAP